MLKRTLKLSFVLALMAGAQAQAFDRDISSFQKWNSVIENEKVTVRPAKRDLDTLQRVMDSYSDIAYRSDSENYSVEDYWATRAEMKKKGAGDCEDFASAWYFDLIEAGFKDEDLRLVVVTKKYSQELHAVLTVRLGGKTYVMDSERAKVQPASYMGKFIVAYRINREGWER